MTDIATRIGFTGAHGSGKTTLADMMEDDNTFGSISRPKSASRAALDVGVNINRDADPFSQLLMTIANINKEYIDDDEEDFIISERTPLDTMAYSLYQITYKWTEMDPSLLDFMWENIKKICLVAMNIYDVLFYFPPYFAPADDGGTRDTDREYQMEIDLFLKKIIDANDIPVHIVPDTDPQERLVWIKEVLANA